MVRMRTACSLEITEAGAPLAPESDLELHVMRSVSHELGWTFYDDK